MERHLRRSWARSARQSEVGKPSRRTGAAGRPQYQRAGARPSDARRGSRGGSARPISRYTSGIHEHRRGNQQPNQRREQQGEHFRAFHVMPLFFCVFPIYDTLSSTAGIIRQETVEGQNGALNRPTVSPGEVSGIETAGAAQQRITARASGSGGAARWPCASSRVIFIPVTQTRLTAVPQPPGRFSASARPHLTVYAR